MSLKSGTSFSFSNSQTYSASWSTHLAVFFCQRSTRHPVSILQLHKSHHVLNLFALVIFSLFACITILIAILVGQKEKQSSEFVWTTLTNNTGWPSGIAFLITLSGPTVMYCPIDGVVHLVEDAKKPRVVVPRAIMSALALSFASATAFGIATTYCISDFDTALASRTGFPAFEIWRQAMNSNAWAVAFMVFLLVMVPAGTFTTAQIVCRMTWSFANDKALLFSDRLSSVSPKTRVPLMALTFNAFLIFLIGCLYLISSTGKRDPMAHFSTKY